MNWTLKDIESAEDLIIHIFTVIFPQYGMNYRENQLELARSMFTAMLKNKIALCEAEVGTGKTHAYIIAAIVYRLLSKESRPTIISTSTLALQKAITEEYIPRISDILLENGIISVPLTYIVRKGKSHYICDSRLKTYLLSIMHNKFEDEKLIEKLAELHQGSAPIDLDVISFSDYVKKRICVVECQYHCEFAESCKYRKFRQQAVQRRYDFQVTNHNMVLADILNRKDGKDSLLPDRSVIIYDEAHKLIDAAKQMYELSLTKTEISRLLSNIHIILNACSEKRSVIAVCSEIEQTDTSLFMALENLLKANCNNNCFEIELGVPIIRLMTKLHIMMKRLSSLLRVDRHMVATIKMANRVEQVEKKIADMSKKNTMVYWLEKQKTTAFMLCALPKQLDFLLFNDMWRVRMACILTSATLSVDGCFENYTHQTGIDFIPQQRLLTVSKRSPFDYNRQALLYLPKNMPFPDIHDRSYFFAVVGQLTGLIKQTHGHTLVLFTSYKMMELVYQELCSLVTDYPLFCMGKGRLDAMEAFRNSGNGILLASDNAGEGIDLAGDILSSLVIVKLPFPMPNAVDEYERTQYKSFEDYLSDNIVPNMLMKLRQWIGRGIRRETDSCVISILDRRANHRYKADILAVLPDMPVTDKLSDVGKFILCRKNKQYFDEIEREI